MSKRREKNKPKVGEQLSVESVTPAYGYRTNADHDTLAFEGGKFCLDVAKLVFAGVILAGIMKEDANPAILYTTGVIVVLFFVVFGFYLIKHSKRK